MGNKDRMKPGDLVKSMEAYDDLDGRGSFHPVGFIIELHATRDMRRTVQWVYPTVFKETFVNIQDLKLMSSINREDLCK